MTNVNWKEGGDKPLAKADVCAICGEAIFAQSRDYMYGKDGEKWVRAHRWCVPQPKNMDDINQETLDVLYRIAEGIEKLVAQGAK